MGNFTESIFTNSQITVASFFIVLLVSLVAGFVFSWMCFFKGKSSKSFFITTAMIPACVAMVIMLVNGNIGAGVAVAGAFGLVRFRSAQGSAKQICIIFIAMAAGLAFGMGYVFYGSIFMVITGVMLMLFSAFKLWETKIDPLQKNMKITIPENLDYNSVFDDLLSKYTKEHELIKVKSTNMGSMFQLTYHIELKDSTLEKEFIDQIRCRNGNLEIMLERVNYENQDL